jgi:hypothetical protein
MRCMGAVSTQPLAALAAVWESRSLPALLRQARSETIGLSSCTAAGSGVRAHAVSHALHGRCFHSAARGGAGEQVASRHLVISSSDIWSLQNVSNFK